MKTFVIVLSGGKGERVGINKPKQYIEVAGKPIIMYSLSVFENSNKIDGIIVVSKAEWKSYISECVSKSGLKKVFAYAEGGDSRQESVLNGLIIARQFLQKDDIVLIHDAARPCVTNEIIEDVLDLGDFDGVMPAIPVNDTIYMAENNLIGCTLNRDILYAGQAPESYVFGKYLEINEQATKQDLMNTRGSSEIAVKNGMKIRIGKGDSRNSKITTLIDLQQFKSLMEK